MDKVGDPFPRITWRWSPYDLLQRVFLHPTQPTSSLLSERALSTEDHPIPSIHPVPLESSSPADEASARRHPRPLHGGVRGTAPDGYQIEHQALGDSRIHNQPSSVRAKEQDAR